jgi:hypothetical protein
MAAFNIDPSISLGVKPPAAIGIGDIMNIARGAQAYKQAQETNPNLARAIAAQAQEAETSAELAKQTMQPKIQMQQSQTELAGTQTQKAKFNFGNEQAQVVNDETNALMNDPRIMKAENTPEGRHGALSALLESKKRAIKRGVPEVLVESLTAPYIAAASTDPTTIRQEMLNSSRAASGATAQANLNNPQLTTNARGQAVVANAATGQYDVVGTPEANPRNAAGEWKTDALGRQYFVPYTSTGLPGAPQGIGEAPAESAPAAPTVISRNETGGAKVAADVNNPGGIKVNGKFAEYKTPAAGVRATQSLVGEYLSGEGPMANVKPTPENVVGMWVNGKPDTGSKVMGGAYVAAVKQELQNAGVKLNADGSIPDTPMAVAAVTTAKIKMEAGPNAAKFLGGQQPAKSTFVQPTESQTAETIKANINTGYNHYQQSVDQLNNPDSKSGHLPSQLFNNQNILKLIKDPEVDTARIANYFSDPVKYKLLSAKEQDLAKYLEQRVQGKNPSSAMDLESKHKAYGTTALKKEALMELIRNETGTLTSQELQAKGRIRAAGDSSKPDAAAVNKFDNTYANYAKDPLLMKYIGIVGEGKTAHLDKNDLEDISKLFARLPKQGTSYKEAQAALELKRQALIKLVNGEQ